MTRKIKVFSLYSNDEIESLNRLLKIHSKAKLTYMTPANGYGSGGALVIADYEDDEENDDLPVIPKAWADTIEEYKANHYRLEKIFTDALILNYDEQNVVARAWLDGYRVEEDK